MTKNIPELLCPAGSPEALEAAIEGGANAVYLGGPGRNARMHAKNFTERDLSDGIRLAHTYGVKVYVTLNTLATDRELPEFLSSAEKAAEAGADALIVADLGGAVAIHRTFPKIELHASTQMSGHNASMGKELQKIGFSRMVLSREISKENLTVTVKNCPIETELFVHGALCVSHSGQCLFSSLVGDRSGNRGECAQPCRLPYEGNRYPLSLKDLSLAGHVPEIILAGVSSLKIEGRMKSPEYVRDTARIWRKLLDENRAATAEEMQTLAGVFSRSGLTDGYFTGKIDQKMLGVRREEDKNATQGLEPFRGLTKKIPVDLSFLAKKEIPLSMTVSDGSREVTLAGSRPLLATGTPTTKEQVEKNIGKLGDTPYAIRSLKIDLDEGLLLPVSAIKDLRRRAMEAWGEEPQKPLVEKRVYVMKNPQKKAKILRTGRFFSEKQITPLAKSFFDRIFLPLFQYSEKANGVILPPVIFEKDREKVKEELRKVKDSGAVYALCGNLGHFDLLAGTGLLPIGDYRLNVTNRESMAFWEDFGLSSVVLSPELTLPQMRDVGGASEAIVYGRIPLMTLEKCVAKDTAGCSSCEKGTATLRDRRGVVFPVLREWEHRSVIYNSIPTGMSDKEEDLMKARIFSRQFLFSVETGEEVDNVIRAYQNGNALPFPVRRIRN